MKKRFAAVMLIVVLTFALAGCGDKTVISMTIDGMEGYELCEIPTDAVNCASSPDGITVTIEEDGEYQFGLRDEEGNVHRFTLSYEDKKAEIRTDDDLSIGLSIEE